MKESARLIGTGGVKGCKFGCLYCFTREPNYQRCPRFDILRTKDLVNTSLASRIVQPACDTEFLTIDSWKDYLDELISTNKIISFATKSDINAEDLQFFKEINEILITNGKILHIGITIVRLKDWKEIEPHAPSPSSRIKTLRKLWDSGIPTIVLIRPLMPMLTTSEIDEIVEKTYRFCHGYLSGPLYLTPPFEKYLKKKKIKFSTTERIATWQLENPVLRIIESPDLENYLYHAVKKKGRLLFDNNVEAAIYSSSILKQEWVNGKTWSPNIRREQVATTYIIDPVSKEFFLMFHRNLGKWLPPGGHVEANESCLQAAIREAKEELGINLNFIKLKGKLDRDGFWFRRIPSPLNSQAFCIIEEFIQPIGAQDPHIHVDSIYVGTVDSKSPPEKRDKSEVTAMDWFNLSEIEQLETFDNVPFICRNILYELEKRKV